MTPPPAHKRAEAFCRDQLGDGCFDPFTQQDASGWRAFAYLVELWGVGDAAGRETAIVAMRAVLGGVQNKESIHQVFCQTIPALLDWSHADEIWPQLLAGAPGYAGTNWRLTPVGDPRASAKAARR